MTALPHFEMLMGITLEFLSQYNLASRKVNFVIFLTTEKGNEQKRWRTTNWWCWPNEVQKALGGMYWFAPVLAEGTDIEDSDWMRCRPKLFYAALSMSQTHIQAVAFYNSDFLSVDVWVIGIAIRTSLAIKTK